MEENFKFPTETVELPSLGLIYPKDNPLSSGKIEMKYMTAKEEDILTNQNYIKDGSVLDKLIKSLIVSKIDYDDLVVGDKNAVLVAARILGYGADYTFKYGGQEETVDLSTLETKYLTEDSLKEKHVNRFEFTCPASKTVLEFKLLSGKDDKKVKSEIKGLQKINKNSNPEMSTRLKYMILSVDGKTDNKDIRDFVDNYFLARDSRALREHIKSFQPDIDMTFNLESSGGIVEKVSLPMTVNFFWPDSTL
jgi:hypothetical protein|tara:strand:- start:395 stop:1144 length:750 start_codon:yes stop_codon:yes gene_type:complete